MANLHLKAQVIKGLLRHIHGRTLALIVTGDFIGTWEGVHWIEREPGVKMSELGQPIEFTFLSNDSFTNGHFLKWYDYN